MMVVMTKRTMNITDAWLETKPVAQMAKRYNGWLSQCIAVQTLQRLYAKTSKRTDSVLPVRLTDEIYGCMENWRTCSLKIQPVRCVNI